MVATFLGILIAASWVFWLLALVLTCRLYSDPAEVPDGSTPPVSILKPLKGADPGLYDNFVSFVQQDYPEFELLFVVEDATDSAVEVVTRLQHDFPDREIHLTVAPPEQANRKASMLDALSTQARYEILVASDSDIRVGPEYLRRVVGPLTDPTVGLVTCLYRGADALTLSARMEALHMGATFLPSVTVARLVLGMRFAMGATVALRRDALRAIGGFASVADYLADDYQLGSQVAGAGYTVVLSDYVVDSVLGPTTFRDQWDREIRWSHCSRVSRPLEYPGVLLTFSTPLSLLALLMTGFSGLAWAALVASLLLRWVVSWVVTGVTDNRRLRRWLILLPIRDLLSALVWLAGSVGRDVTWRGVSYILLPGGRLEPTPADRKHVWGDAD